MSEVEQHERNKKLEALRQRIPPPRHVRICEWDRHQNLIICCQPSLKISSKSVRKFLHEVANKQTNNDDYITSLAEVTKKKEEEELNILTPVMVSAGL